MNRTTTDERNELTAADFRRISEDIESEVSKIIVGQKEVIRHVLIGILANGHVLLEGVPGLGKTMLVRAMSQALDLEFSRIQFTPDLMPADITGTDIMDEGADGRRAFRFQKGPIFSNLLLADEINRATPKTQSALLEAMQERTVTVSKETYVLPKPFFALATQNPLEMEGTYPLPEAQIDRFLFKVNVPFPGANELTEILSRTTGSELPEVGKAAGALEILAMQELARQVPVPSQVSEYISLLIVATHPEQSPAELVNQYVRYGSSPRGGQALVLGAKIKALLASRFNVSFEDVVNVALASLRHRLILNFEGQAAGITADEVVEQLLETTPRPH